MNESHEGNNHAVLCVIHHVVLCLVFSFSPVDVLTRERMPGQVWLPDGALLSLLCRLADGAIVPGGGGGVCTGLAACLNLIKEKGILKDKVQWAGRTNDKKPVALIGLGDVYTGGSHEDAMQQRIETALTQRDEFGRVMTPKERFRVMCHQ